ncbi:hypothetical protein [Mailhella massiliensis]|uniref:hypothetical protein n=1 Tax=Mailhella massiliensis TaxID=1903261 RepID=UPI00097DA9A2|nr:hypothetical protein [Mailhella massiliensis]
MVRRIIKYRTWAARKAEQIDQAMQEAESKAQGRGRVPKVSLRKVELGYLVARNHEERAAELESELLDLLDSI